MTKRRVGVIMGGCSSEREVSLRSGTAVAKALRALGHDVVQLVLGPGGDIGLALRRADIDLAFLALHGRHGEDGCVQGLCELYGIPYTGSSVLASALAMDKVKSKELFRLYNVPTPPYYTVAAGLSRADRQELHGSFGFPSIVKPRREGSSIGLAKVGSFAELENAVDGALTFDAEAIVERFVSGREVHVGVLDGRVLGAVEVAPKKGIYDYEAKYTPGMTDYHLPPRVEATRLRGLFHLAERAVGSLGCSGAVRVDMLVTEGQNEYVLEVNTLPGMTETSLLPKIAAAAGYDFPLLCETILAGARLYCAAPAPRAPRESSSDIGAASPELDLAGDAIAMRATG